MSHLWKSYVKVNMSDIWGKNIETHIFTSYGWSWFPSAKSKAQGGQTQTGVTCTGTQSKGMILNSTTSSALLGWIWSCHVYGTFISPPHPGFSVTRRISAYLSKKARIHPSVVAKYMLLEQRIYCMCYQRVKTLCSLRCLWVEESVLCQIRPRGFEKKTRTDFLQSPFRPAPAMSSSDNTPAAASSKGIQPSLYIEQSCPWCNARRGPRDLAQQCRV